MQALVVSSASFFSCLSWEGVLPWSAQLHVGDIGPWPSSRLGSRTRALVFVLMKFEIWFGLLVNL